MSTTSSITRPILARERREAVFGTMPHAHRRILQRTAIALRRVDDVDGHRTADQLYTNPDFMAAAINGAPSSYRERIARGAVTGRFSARNPPQALPSAKSPLTGSAGALAPVSPDPAFLHDPEPDPGEAVSYHPRPAAELAAAKRSEAARKAAATRKANNAANIARKPSGGRLGLKRD